MKNRKIHEFALPNQAKPLCVKFGLKSHAIMVTGDNQNSISLWRLNKDRPLATLAPRHADPHAKEITSVCYALNQNEIFSGNNVGSFGVWNIQAQSMNKEFKEHSAAINCITPSFNSDTLVITGSLDSSVKEWDTRQKASVMTYSGHTMKINCIEFSPDGTLFITGSDDQLLKLWDIRTRKCIKTFNLHKAPITCAKFNPEEITLATTSSDGILNYWDLENFELMFQSNIDSNGIQQIAFDQDGGHFFTAAKDVLRVWRVNADGLSLMTNVESKWDTIQDLVIQNSTKTPTPTNALIGAVLGKTSFELWGSQFDDLKKIQKDPITIFKKFVPEEEDDSGDIPAEMSRPQVLGRQSSKPFEHFSDVVSFEVANQEADSPKEEEKEEEEPDQDQNRKDCGDESPQENEQKPEVEDAGQGNHAEEYDGSKVEEHLEFNELLESTKFVRESIINIEKHSPTQLDLSAYLNGITGEDKKNEFDAIGEISKEHAKFEANMMQRAINVRQISSTWKTERALKTLPTLEKLAGNDSPLILSLITISVIAHRIEKLPLEIVCVLLRKVPILIETNFDLYIRVSLGFSLTVLEAFDKEIIPRKVLHTPNKIAQPKAEIPRKYAKLISTFEWFTQQEIIKKLANKTDNQLGKIAKKALHDVGAFLVRVNNPAPTPVRTPSKAKK